jgi:hypothetical protein
MQYKITDLRYNLRVSIESPRYRLYDGSGVESISNLEYFIIFYSHLTFFLRLQSAKQRAFVSRIGKSRTQIKMQYCISKFVPKST